MPGWGLDRFLQRFCWFRQMGVPHILFIIGEFGRGTRRTHKFKIVPVTKHPKHVPKGPRRPPGPPQNVKRIFWAPSPGPVGPVFWPTGPKGVLYNSRSTSYDGLYW